MSSHQKQTKSFSAVRINTGMMQTLHYCFASAEAKVLQITIIRRGNFQVLQGGRGVQLQRTLEARTRPSGETPGLSTIIFALLCVFQLLNISEVMQINNSDDCA